MFHQLLPANTLSARIRLPAPGGWLVALAALALLLLQAGPVLAQRADAADAPDAANGPVRLRPAAPVAAPAMPSKAAPAAANEPGATPATAVAAEVLGEFESYVRRLQSAPRDIRRLGNELLLGGSGMATDDLRPGVPDDYVIAPGDEILLTIWGSVEADLRLTVDRAGRIAVPRVGTIQLSGVRYAELPAVISRRVAAVFRNFELTATLGQLRGMRVFVTGNVLRPGAHVVNSLGTVVTALAAAGGPSAAGTFRRIELRRGASTLGTFDLYDLLTKGERKGDVVLQAGDVVHVGAIGSQIAVIGSVNRPAVIEVLPTETVADALRLAGGYSSLADRRRIAIERLEDRLSGRIVQLEWPRDQIQALAAGDVLRVFSAVEAILPTQQQSKRVRVEGEVLRPGEYVLPASSSVRDALAAAGGLTPGAHVFATEFERESVRVSQQENFDRALRELEIDLARVASARRVDNNEAAFAQQSGMAAQTRLLDRMRALKPTGRIVLQLAPDSRELPDLALEDGDRLYVPALPTTVGVFGNVFNAGTYLHNGNRTLGDYLRLAGGPTKAADRSSVFVVRANGQVLSSRQRPGGSSFFADDRFVSEQLALPGDTLFVPGELDRTTFVQAAKDWTQVLYQFGIGLAGIRNALLR